MHKVEIGNRDRAWWGSVSRGRKYFTVETFSRYQGARSGVVVRVPFDAVDLRVDRHCDLAADYNGGMSNAEYICWFSESNRAQCTVVRRGDIVQ